MRHIIAGPFEGLDKEDLPGQLCSFAAGVMRAEARREAGFYDVIHSHYWLSGQVGYLAKERWGVPLVHSAHTLGRVKNAALADDDDPEPRGRLIGEDQVIAEADRFVASTGTEAGQLVELYGADPTRIDVVPPGVDTDVFSPDGPHARERARAALGIPAADRLIAFAGRIQPLKAPDVLINALRVLADRHPDESWRVLILGGESGSGRHRERWLTDLAERLGVADRVEFRPPVPAAELADIYRAADVVAVPSYNESFGLVALEAQAAGTPVVAAAVGGLRVAVDDGVTGELVDGHDPQTWAERIAAVVLDDDRRARMAEAAPRHAARFSWDVTVDGLLECYERARSGHMAALLAAVDDRPAAELAGR